MPTPITVTAVPLAFNPYSAFKQTYEQALLKAFKAGALLHVWRNSSPWNFWLEGGPEKVNMMTVSDARPLKNLARPAGTSAALVSGSISPSENGLAQQQAWEFDPERAMALEEHWTRTNAEYEERRQNRKPMALNVDALSSKALALLRTLRGGNCIARHPELASLFEELDAQGLLEMMRDGRFKIVPAGQRLSLPRGLQLQPLIQPT